MEMRGFLSGKPRHVSKPLFGIDSGLKAPARFAGRTLLVSHGQRTSPARTAEETSYLLCNNHHDFVIGWGEAPQWVARLWAV